MNLEGRSLLLIGILALALALAAIGLACDDASGQVPTITVEIDDEDEQQTAHSTNVFQDLLTFHGNITLAHPLYVPGKTTVITPVVEFPDGVTPWETNINPPALSFTSQGTQNFTVQLTVPTGLLATDLFRLVFSATTDDLVLVTIVDDDGLVSIAQYYIINRQFSTEPIKVKQGQAVDFNLTLINKGNGADTFSLSISNEDELAFFKVYVFFEQSKRVQPDAEVRISFRVEADDGARVGEFQLNVTIRSDESRTDVDHAEVVNGAEFTIVVQPSIISSIKDYWYVVAIAVVAIAGVGILLKVRSDKAFEKEFKEYEKAQAEKVKGKGKAKGKTMGKAKGTERAASKAKAKAKLGSGASEKATVKPSTKRLETMDDDDAEDDL
jgi:hypothetical protein